MDCFIGAIPSGGCCCLQGQYEMDVASFCERSVDVMGEESDHIHAQALTDALKVGDHPLLVTTLCCQAAQVQHEDNPHEFFGQVLLRLRSCLVYSARCST
jgi:hypothetical protein